MPKLKTHKGTAKRVKITRTGKVLREDAASHHFMTHHTARNNRSKRTASVISGKNAKNVKRAIGE
ncbi:50S ribosomal protein L35 [Alphaproteobacteria bacterium]|nr:50S ribosomal protein L35 [Alphaproteobacteria bacterium]